MRLFEPGKVSLAVAPRMDMPSQCLGSILRQPPDPHPRQSPPGIDSLVHAIGCFIGPNSTPMGFFLLFRIRPEHANPSLSHRPIAEE
ncbi:hypothetical protein BO71DRAFT_73310 [Aspergillus ellipticus CBS 707.79]|uniref:Uncharacterized protein n=1 Tax=Aspergillus ellipticus CBS 707.79 TaxID=1448320 RepID=A0A319D0N4_9EURO|nr:hypothetical protein BO71DRAFT_73310 [Aspergillus ellipticus CBS 707.79]